MESGSIKRGMLFFVIIMLFLSAGYIFYCRQASQTYEQAYQAYLDHDWQSAKADFRNMQTIYHFSLPDYEKDVDDYLSIINLFINLEKTKAENNYRQVHEIYSAINTVDPALYADMDLHTEEIDYLVNEMRLMEEDKQFSSAIDIYQFMNDLSVLDDAAGVDESTLANLHYQSALMLMENGQYHKSIQELNFIKNNYQEEYDEKSMNQLLGQIHYLMADELISNSEYELALEELMAFHENGSDTEKNLETTNLIIETKINTAAAFHDNHEFDKEITLLKEIKKSAPDTVQIDDINRNLAFAYEAYADQLAIYGDFYSAMINYELAIDIGIESESIARITDKNEKTKAILLTDSGEAGQMLLDKIANEICSGSYELPAIVENIPETADKAIVCENSQLSLPAAQTAQNLAELKYVVIIQNKFNDVQNCRYDNRKRFLVRRQKYTTISLYDVTLMNLSATTDIYGSSPVTCPDHYLFNEYLADRISENLKAKVSDEERTESAAAFSIDLSTRTNYYLINRYSAFLLGEDVPEIQIKEWLNEYLP